MAIHWSTAQLGSALSRWIGLGFASGSACFLIGPFPGYVQLLGAEADGITFFVGSLFFTAAATLQALSTHGGSLADPVRRDDLLQRQHLPGDADLDQQLAGRSADLGPGGGCRRLRQRRR